VDAPGDGEAEAAGDGETADSWADPTAGTSSERPRAATRKERRLTTARPYQKSLHRTTRRPTIVRVDPIIGAGRPSPLAATLDTVFPDRGGDTGPVIVARAPGRVNLIGEHTDYNGGFVLPFAIDLDVRIALRPVDEPRIRVHRTDTRETAEIDLAPFPPPGDAWHDYVAGTAWALAEHDQPVRGFDGVIVSSLPIGSGLSSSAALEVATAWAVSAPAGPVVSPLEVARIAQFAENEHVGVRCGLMDQFASACGAAGSALLLDCRSTEWRAVDLPEDLALVVVHSGVSHGHAGNEYNDRRAACERVVAAVAADDPAVTLLRDVDLATLERYRERLDPRDQRRARHVLTENVRVLDAVAALEAGDEAALGELLAGSQASMRDDYDISCPEIDALVEIAIGVPGVIGSRMTGGGFGGCTITLARPDAVADLREVVARDYPGRTGRNPRLWVVSATEGAGYL
jgi:galactokinase